MSSELPAFTRAEWAAEVQPWRHDPDAPLADELEQQPPPHGVIGALVTCDNRLRARIVELEAHAADSATRYRQQQEAITILEGRIADLEATTEKLLEAMNSLLDTFGVPRF